MVRNGLVVVLTSAAVMWNALLRAQEGEKPVRSKPVKVCFEYRPDLSRQVGMRIGVNVHVGHLYSDGTFFPDRKSEPIPIVSAGSGSAEVYRRLLLDLAMTNVINDPERYRGWEGVVYEYRSGMLVKGRLDEDGRFIPEPYTKVITLLDYLNDYDPEQSPRIYNLPGRIVTVIQND